MAHGSEERGVHDASLCPTSISVHTSLLEATGDGLGPLLIQEAQWHLHYFSELQSSQSGKLRLKIIHQMLQHPIIANSREIAIYLYNRTSKIISTDGFQHFKRFFFFFTFQKFLSRESSLKWRFSTWKWKQIKVIQQNSDQSGVRPWAVFFQWLPPYPLSPLAKHCCWQTHRNQNVTESLNLESEQADLLNLEPWASILEAPQYMGRRRTM